MSGKVLGWALLIVAILASAAWGWPGCDQDQIWAVVEGDAVTLFHHAAAYNCCLDSVANVVTQTPGRIEVRATEFASTPCACLCCYNLSVRLEDVSPGLWTLVYVWDDYDTGETEEWTEEIVVGGASPGPVFIASSSRSDCLDMTSSPEPRFDAGPWGRVKALYR